MTAWGQWVIRLLCCLICVYAIWDLLPTTGSVVALWLILVALFRVTEPFEKQGKKQR
jgi:predicted metal-binding membrane protein